MQSSSDSNNAQEAAQPVIRHSAKSHLTCLPADPEKSKPQCTTGGGSRESAVDIDKTLGFLNDSQDVLPINSNTLCLVRLSRLSIIMIKVSAKKYDRAETEHG